METTLIRKLGYRVKRKLRTVQAFIPAPNTDMETMIGQIGLSDPTPLLDSFPALFHGLRSPNAACFIKKMFPKHLRQAELIARSALKHRFDFLGSGPVELGSDIDWSQDFKTGEDWGMKDFRLLKLVDLRNHSDCKIPWELSRFNHFQSMALVYLVTNDHAYPIEFENQVVSWCNHNQYQQGVNWTCPMETAFRVINWLLAYQTFASQWIFSDEFKTLLIVEMYKAGKFIRDNLEYTGSGFNSNHYISNLVGLLYLGRLFIDQEKGKEWLRFAIESLEKEIELQVTSDGLDYESSLPYHGLVTELFLHTYLLSQQCDFSFSDHFASKLKSMIENLKRFTGSDGTVLPFGDADDGRLIRFFNRHPRDFRDIIALGETVLDMKESPWKISLPEELIYFERKKDSNREPTHFKSTIVKSFTLKESGIFQMRSKDIVLNFFANNVGTAGLGNHKHNDILSFTLEFKGKPIFIDPGTYVYSADERWRNHFRSTAAHNTVVVDKQEQNRFVRGHLFVLRHDSRPAFLHWSTNDRVDLVCAENDGYTRLDDPVIHRRSVFFDKKYQVILIKDELFGNEQHHLEFNFHLNKMRVKSTEQNRMILIPNDLKENLLFCCLNTNKHFTFGTNWISPSYGVKYPGVCLSLEHDIILPSTTVFAITPCPVDNLSLSLQRIAQARQAIKW